MRYFWLNFHRPYRCRHSLACCRSGWPIPIERDRALAVEAEIGSGRVHPLKAPWLVPPTGAPTEIAGTLAIQSDGGCVFLRLPAVRLRGRRPLRRDLAEAGPISIERRRAGSRLPVHGSCGIYSNRPLSCVHFPYVCLIDQRGVHVTLSHYCPTAASLLFEHDGPIEILEGPSPVPELEIPEGLDARESLPPLASPDRLMSFDEFSAWESEQVSAFAAGRRFHLRQGFGGLVGETSPTLFETAVAAVPAPLNWPAAPDAIERGWEELVAPAWESFARVVDRYLAARLFASWQAYLGDGPPDILRGVAIAEAVLRVESVRQCMNADRSLDASLLKEAIRHSDLLLVHYADRTVLNGSRKPEAES